MSGTAPTTVPAASPAKDAPNPFGDRQALAIGGHRGGNEPAEAWTGMSAAQSSASIGTTYIASPIPSAA